MPCNLIRSDSAPDICNLRIHRLDTIFQQVILRGIQIMVIRILQACYRFRSQDILRVGAKFRCLQHKILRVFGRDIYILGRVVANPVHNKLAEWDGMRESSIIAALLRNIHRDAAISNIVHKRIFKGNLLIRKLGEILRDYRRALRTV